MLESQNTVNTTTRDRNKIDLAVIRMLVAQGVTTPSTIAKHVTCNKKTISRHLTKVSQEINSKADKFALYDPYASTKVDLVNLHHKQLEELQKQASELLDELKLTKVGSSPYLAIQRAYLALLSEINKLSGLAMAMDLSKARQLRELDKQEEAGEMRVAKKRGYTPKVRDV